MSSNDLPEITCLMISSLDGKGTGDFLFHKACECSLFKYFGLETKLGIQGYIMGTNTYLSDYAPKNYKPDLSKFKNTNISKSEDYISKEKGEYYAIAFDIEGEIPWKTNKGVFLSEFGRNQVSHIFEVVTEKASKEYLAYLTFNISSVSNIYFLIFIKCIKFKKYRYSIYYWGKRRN